MKTSIDVSMSQTLFTLRDQPFYIVKLNQNIDVLLISSLNRQALSFRQALFVIKPRGASLLHWHLSQFIKQWIHPRPKEGKRNLSRRDSDKVPHQTAWPCQTWQVDCQIVRPSFITINRSEHDSSRLLRCHQKAIQLGLRGDHTCRLDALDYPKVGNQRVLLLFYRLIPNAKRRSFWRSPLLLLEKNRQSKSDELFIPWAK